MAAKIISKKNTKDNRNLLAKKELEKSVNFEFYAPLANEVSVAGEFNNWNAELNKLKKDTSGHWRGSFNLEPGRYEYRFLVDGNWENDPKSIEFIPNAFGTWNCVLEVR